MLGVLTKKGMYIYIKMRSAVESNQDYIRDLHAILAIICYTMRYIYIKTNDEYKVETLTVL